MKKKYIVDIVVMLEIRLALVAQLDRAFGYEPKGRGFESLQAQIKNSLRRVFLCYSFGTNLWSFQEVKVNLL